MQGNHRVTEDTEESDSNFAHHPESTLTRRIIGIAINVQRELGPGLLESTYEECLGYELRTAEIAHARQVPLPIRYKEISLNCGYRMDFVIEQRLHLELKSVEQIIPIHEAQILTYLRLSGLKVGLLMNFNTVTLKDGLRRYVR